jgi:hypothetical protein
MQWEEYKQINRSELGLARRGLRKPVARQTLPMVRTCSRQTLTLLHPTTAVNLLKHKQSGQSTFHTHRHPTAD